MHSEALAWLAEHPAPAQASVITSLPDQSELPSVGFEAWRAWFVNAARALLRWIPKDGTAIFYQRDVRHDEAWVDKAQLVHEAAAAEAWGLVWHKIVCRRAPDTAGRDARPGFSHLLCFQRSPRAPRHPLPDVLTDAGPGSWSRAMGSAACVLACDHLRYETTTCCVVDPFCGRGSVLAVAAAVGFDVIGVESNARRCRAARSLLARTRLLQDAIERGAELFDRGEFFAAHEVWEDRWRVSRDEDERRGLQGLIQVAAAFHKLFEMRDPESARRLLDKSLVKLDATHWLPGVELAVFRRALRATVMTPETPRDAAPRLSAPSSPAHPASRSA